MSFKKSKFENILISAYACTLYSDIRIHDRSNVNVPLLKILKLFSNDS